MESTEAGEKGEERAAPGDRNANATARAAQSTEETWGSLPFVSGESFHSSAFHGAMQTAGLAWATFQPDADEFRLAVSSLVCVERGVLSECYHEDPVVADAWGMCSHVGRSTSGLPSFARASR